MLCSSLLCDLLGNYVGEAEIRHKAGGVAAALEVQLVQARNLRIGVAILVRGRLGLDGRGP